MRYTIELYTKTKNYKRDSFYHKNDITNEVVMPIIDVQRLDKPLDTSSLVLYRESHRVIRPFSRVIIRIEYDDGSTENIYRLVQSDSVELSIYGANKLYKHELELIEPTKWLERFIVDNTTVTNLLAFLYSDNPAFFPSNSIEDIKINYASRVKYTYAKYTNNNKYMKDYYIGSTFNTDVGYSVYGAYSIFNIGIVLAEISYQVTTPSGQVIEVDPKTHLPATITINEEGTYVARRIFKYADGTGRELSISVTWKINGVKKESIATRKPTRYTIKDVLENILSKVSSETTAPRKNLDSQLFRLDSNLTGLDKVFSPEFTFTQNTLFGMLEQVGNYIHAIPRLIPSFNGEDDYSNWDTITFDFLGDREHDNLDNYEIIAEDYSLDADNYTSGFVSNIANSFQTNNVDYISMKEPYENGYLSSRTEDGNFEISNNNAVIKTSRPIQRIISLKVMIAGQMEQPDTPQSILPRIVDISRYVKESSDYLLLKDYPYNAGEIIALKTKSTALTYSRGSNVISGLTYIPPKEFQVEILTARRAIENIINLETGEEHSYTLKNLSFNIEYVPFYSFKAKQYKTLIDDESGDNELYYNQDSQSVDIESFGENVKGALMMSGNVDKSLTGYNMNPTAQNQATIGKLLEDYYYIYQINREFIDKNVIKSTIRLSKNFNKLNGYLGIKKNYREWEISNKECYEMNPMINNFCIVTLETEFDKIAKLPISDEEKHRLNDEFGAELDSSGGFVTEKVVDAIRQAFKGSSSPVDSISWVSITTRTVELDFDSKEQIITKSFLVPATSFSMGLSIVVNFTTQDNFAVNTTTIPAPTSDGFSTEEYVSYGNKYGVVDEAFMLFGGGEPFESKYYPEKLQIGKRLYKLPTDRVIDKTKGIVDFYDTNYPIIIKKDSRQKLNFSAQLNFVTDNPKIWISSELPKLSPLVGKQEVKGCYLAFFKKTPSQFLNKFDKNDVEQTRNPFIASVAGEYSVWINGYFDGDATSNIVPCDCVGVGIVKKTSTNIDNNDKILIYYNKAYKQGEQLDNIYLLLRRKI